MTLSFEGDTVEVMRVVVKGSRHIIDVPLLHDEDLTLKCKVVVREISYRHEPKTGVMERLHHLEIMAVEVDE